MINSKIKKKVTQLKVDDKQPDNDKSLLLDFHHNVDDRESFLDYTLDHGNMVKKPKKQESEEILELFKDPVHNRMSSHFGTEREVERGPEQPEAPEELKKVSTKPKFNIFKNDKKSNENKEKRSKRMKEDSPVKDKEEDILFNMQHLVSNDDDNDYNVNFGDENRRNYDAEYTPEREHYDYSKLSDNDRDRSYGEHSGPPRERKTLRMLDELNNEKLEGLDTMKEFLGNKRPSHLKNKDEKSVISELTFKSTLNKSQVDNGLTNESYSKNQDSSNKRNSDSISKVLPGEVNVPLLFTQELSPKLDSIAEEEKLPHAQYNRMSSDPPIFGHQSKDGRNSDEDAHYKISIKKEADKESSDGTDISGLQSSRIYPKNSYLGMKVKNMGTVSDMNNPMNATVDESVLNNEWERILHEVDGGQAVRPTDNKSIMSRKEVIKGVRKRYIRQLIKGSKTINIGIKEAGGAVNRGKDDIVSASAMIDYFNTAYQIGLHAKERLNDADQGVVHSANDIVLQLLLVGSKNIHMHITSDYEMKECEHIFTSMIKRYSF